MSMLRLLVLIGSSSGAAAQGYVPFVGSPTVATCANFACPAGEKLRLQPELLKCDGTCTAITCCLVASVPAVTQAPQANCASFACPPGMTLRLQPKFLVCPGDAASCTAGLCCLASTAAPTAAPVAAPTAAPTAAPVPAPVAKKTCASFACSSGKTLRPQPERLECPTSGCSENTCCLHLYPSKTGHGAWQGNANPCSTATPPPTGGKGKKPPSTAVKGNPTSVIAAAAQVARMHCKPGPQTFQTVSLTDAHVQTAIERGLAFAEAKRATCSAGDLPLFFDAASFLDGSRDTHKAHAQVKFDTTCASQTFKLSFHISTGSASSFVLQVNREFVTDTWQLLDSDPKPCDIKTGTVSSPIYVPVSSKFVVDAAHYAATELTYQQRKAKCLPGGTQAKGWQVKKIHSAMTTVLTGVMISLRLELEAALASPETGILTVLQTCKNDNCLFQLSIKPPATICSPFVKEVTSTVMRKLSTAHDDPTDLLEAQRNELRNPRKLGSGIRNVLQVRHIRTGQPPKKHDPTNSDCFKKITVYNQGDCGSCYAAAVSQMIGIRLCLQEKSKTSRRLDTLPDDDQLEETIEEQASEKVLPASYEEPVVEDKEADTASKDLDHVPDEQERELSASDKVKTIYKTKDADKVKAMKKEEATANAKDKAAEVKSLDKTIKASQKEEYKGRRLESMPDDEQSEEAIEDQASEKVLPASYEQSVVEDKEADAAGKGFADEDEDLDHVPDEQERQLSAGDKVKTKYVKKDVDKVKSMTKAAVTEKTKAKAEEKIGEKALDKSIPAPQKSCQPPKGQSCNEGFSIKVGEKCTQKCPAGYESKPGPKTLECDKGGNLIPAQFAGCEEKSCKAPTDIFHSARSPCKKGDKIDSGKSCTPQCELGYTTTSTALTCSKGKLHAATFTCVPEKTASKFEVKLKLTLKNIPTDAKLKGKKPEEIVKLLNAEADIEALSTVKATSLAKKIRNTAGTAAWGTTTTFALKSVELEQSSSRRLSSGHTFVAVFQVLSKKTTPADSAVEAGNVAKALLTTGTAAISTALIADYSKVVAGGTPIEVMRNGYSIGDKVFWKGADSDVPKGSIGKIVSFTQDRVGVKFSYPLSTWNFKSDELKMATQLGFTIGENVFWKHSDTDVPKNTVGTVMDFPDPTGKKIAVQFGKGTWQFRTDSLEKADKDKICKDSDTWSWSGKFTGVSIDYQGDYDCKFFAKVDPGCKKHKDVGQKTHCQKTCDTCPKFSSPATSPWTGALYKYMPSLNQVAQCAKSDGEHSNGCNGGGLHGVWNNWMRSMTTDLWQMGEKCMPYKLKCMFNDVVQPLTGGNCELFNKYELWHRPCSCIPKSVRDAAAKPLQCPSKPPTADCSIPVPHAMFIVKHMGHGLSNAETVLNIQRHITESGSAGPVWISFDVTARFINNDWKHYPVYAGGKYIPQGGDKDDEQTAGAHAVVAVGWGKMVLDYWLLRNSWSSEWGQEGHFKFQRGVNLNNIESKGIGVSMPKAGYKDWEVPVCHLQTGFSSSVSDSYTPVIRCTKTCDVTLFISNRLKSRKDLKSNMLHIKGSKNFAKVKAYEDYAFNPIKLTSLGFGKLAGTAWIQITSNDKKGNIGDSSVFVEFPALSSARMLQERSLMLV